jgi:hypothetical protein
MKSHRILNISKNIRLKYSQALKSIESCACAWVIEGESIRDLTLKESIQARNEQAKQREPMPNAELPGISYEPSTSGQSAARAGYELIMLANALCGMA